MVHKEYKTMKTSHSTAIHNKKNTHPTLNEDVNPYWPKAQVIPTAIEYRPVQSKPGTSMFIELSKALKSKFISNRSQAK